MPSKKKTEPGDGAEHANGRSPSLATPSLPPPQAQAAAKKPAGAKVAPPPPPSQPVLVISRNKHWRYISSFHGPWLQLPPEILETIANANYNTPRPRPIDPAVFFDLVKIRRLVDDATNLAVRAASGVASIAQRGFPGASPHVAALGFGFGHRPPPEAKLSPERKFRMREQATQKLMRAYRLDEIACSVATMQSASSLEEVASLVLQRNPSDPDARYVHFFHEKIPSRQLAECTSLAPLNEIIAGKPSDPEPLRTRATVRVFKGDYQGAVDDLTLALKLHRLYRPSHVALKRPQQEDKTPQPGTTRKQDDVILKEEDQPGSLEMQLLFQRAGIYLAVACDHVAAALSDSPMARDSVAANGNPDHGHQDGPVAEEQPKPELSPAEKEAQRRRADARKLVRHNAKRALRDYTAYLSHFEYSPDLPIEIAEDFTRRVNLAMNGSRAPRSHSYASGPRSPVACEGEGTSASHRIYALSDLFTSSPPSGLPPYPSTDVVLASRAPPSPPGGHVQTTTETVTCHPLLTDALHALLLCHCLIQTSAKELRRHAYMVARLARLADGYPVFQSSRCPARGDWIEVLRAGNNWIQLAGSWEDLCAPAPLPLFLSTGNGATPVPVSHPASKQHKALTAPGSESAPTSSDDLTASSTVATETEQQRKDRINHQAVLDALGDDRVNDETSLRLAIRARQLRAEHDYRINNAAAALEAKFEAKFARGAASSGKKTPANDQPAPTTAAATTATPSPAAAVPNSNSNGTAKPSPPSAAANLPAAPGTEPTQHQTSGPRRPAAAPSAWAWDDVRDYPIASDRAAAIARWVLEAPPPSAGGGGGGGDGDGDAPRRRRKKPAQKTAAAGAAGAAAAAAGGGAGSGVGSGGLGDVEGVASNGAVTLAVGSGEVATGGRGDDEGLEEGEASV